MLVINYYVSAYDVIIFLKKAEQEPELRRSGKTRGHN